MPLSRVLGVYKAEMSSRGQGKVDPQGLDWGLLRGQTTLGPLNMLPVPGQASTEHMELEAGVIDWEVSPGGSGRGAGETKGRREPARHPPEGYRAGPVLSRAGNLGTQRITPSFVALTDTVIPFLAATRPESRQKHRWVQSEPHYPWAHGPGL